MMKNTKLELVLTATMFLSFFCCGGESCAQMCTKKNAQEIETIAASISSWAQLYDSYKHYIACDDGAIAEGFSESISNLLLTDWGGFTELFVNEGIDSDFKKFVLKHVDETVPEERLKRIMKNIDKKCSPKMDDFCLALKNKIKRLCE